MISPSRYTIYHKDLFLQGIREADIGKMEDALSGGSPVRAHLIDILGPTYRCIVPIMIDFYGEPQPLFSGRLWKSKTGDIDNAFMCATKVALYKKIYKGTKRQEISQFLMKSGASLTQGLKFILSVERDSRENCKTFSRVFADRQTVLDIQDDLLTHLRLTKEEAQYVLLLKQCEEHFLEGVKHTGHFGMLFFGLNELSRLLATEEAAEFMFDKMESLSGVDAIVQLDNFKRDEQIGYLKATIKSLEVDECWSQMNIIDFEERRERILIKLKDLLSDLS